MAKHRYQVKDPNLVLYEPLTSNASITNNPYGIATLTGSPVYSKDASGFNYATFNGPYFQFPLITKYNFSTICTFSFWIRRATDTANYTNHVINKAASMASVADISYIVYFVSSKIRLYISNGSSNNFFDHSTTINDTNWHFVVAGWRGDGVLYISIDGGVYQTGSGGGGITTAQKVTAHPLMIGANFNGTGGFNGDLADLRIYDRLLTQTDIYLLYNKHVNKDNEVPVNSNKILTFNNGSAAPLDDFSYSNGTLRIGKAVAANKGCASNIFEVQAVNPLKTNYVEFTAAITGTASFRADLASTDGGGAATEVILSPITSSGTYKYILSSTNANSKYLQFYLNNTGTDAGSYVTLTNIYLGPSYGPDLFRLNVSGDTISDLTGKTIINTGAILVDDCVRCIEFPTGSTARLDLGTDFIYQKNLTITFWVKPIAAANNPFILDNGSFRLYYGHANYNFVMTTRNATPYPASANNVIKPGTWTYVALVYCEDATKPGSGGSVVTYYINGIPSGTELQGAGVSRTANTNLFIGNIGSDFSRPACARLHGLKIYNRTMTQYEISQKYNRSKTVFNS